MNIAKKTCLLMFGFISFALLMLAALGAYPPAMAAQAEEEVPAFNYEGYTDEVKWKADFTKTKRAFLDNAHHKNTVKDLKKWVSKKQINKLNKLYKNVKQETKSIKKLNKKITQYSKKLTKLQKLKAKKVKAEKKKKQYWLAYASPHITRSSGVCNYNGHHETYYNLYMGNVVNNAHRRGIKGKYWVRADGCKMLGDYIMLAASPSFRKFGSIVKTSLGKGIVVDCGCAHGTIDIAVNW